SKPPRQPSRPPSSCSRPCSNLFSEGPDAGVVRRGFDQEEIRKRSRSTTKNTKSTWQKGYSAPLLPSVLCSCVLCGAPVLSRSGRLALLFQQRLGDLHRI